MAARKRNKAQERRDAIAAWWRRLYWPAVILSSDPGAKSGASILVSKPESLVCALNTAVDTKSRDVEYVVDTAVEVAIQMALPLVLVVETWPAGGTRGIDQWLGLGAARGAWTRAYALAIEGRKDRANGVNLFTSRVARANVTKWRSKMIPESGTRDENGKWTRFDSEGWKAAALKAANEVYSFDGLIESPDAAESLLQGMFAARDDIVGKLLPKTHLARYGLTFPQRDPMKGTPKIRKRKKR